MKEQSVSEKKQGEGREPEKAGRSPIVATISLRRVGPGLLVFYILALALNAASLHRNNEHLPYGPVRTFWVAVSGPVAKGCIALGLDRPREFVAAKVGRALNQ